MVLVWVGCLVSGILYGCCVIVWVCCARGQGSWVELVGKARGSSSWVRLVGRARG